MSFFDYITLQKNHSFLVVMPYDKNDSLERKFNENSIPFIRVKMRTGYYFKRNVRTIVKILLYRLLLYFDYRRIKKTISFSDYDLIHSNSISVQLGAYCAIKQNKVHVWHIREFMEEDYGYHFYNKKMLTNKLLPYSHLILITNAIKDKWGRYSQKESIVLYNGIKDGSKKHIENYDCTKCLIAGNLSTGKGQDEAIRAVWLLRNKGIPIFLYIFGNGENYDNLHLMIKELHGDDYIFLKGFCSDLFDVRKNIDIALVCSKKEALGRVTIESMYAQNVVVGANTGGTKELISHGKTGFLYQQGDIEDLADKILYVINNKNRMDTVKQNALQFAHRFFDPTVYINKLNLFYDRIVK